MIPARRSPGSGPLPRPAAGVLMLGLGLVLTLGTVAVAPASAGRTGGHPSSPSPRSSSAPPTARLAAQHALRIARRAVSGVTPHADASMALLRLRLTLHALAPAERRRAAAVLARPTDNPDLYGQTYTVGAKRRCSRFVCLHWVPTSRDAPPGRRWVDRQLRMLDQVWRYEVHRLGYHRPRSDGSRGGGSGRFDVYLAELYRHGLYGMTVAERRTSRSRHLFSSYLVLDNDFKRSQYHGRPMQIARVTAAHEFFHAIQYGYDVDEDPWLMEASSTWMEDQFDDSSNDNRQYLPWSQLRRPRTPLDTYSDTGFEQYGNWVFLEYLSEQYGRRVVHRIWDRAAELAGGHRYSTQAIRAALRRHGGLTTVFGTYASANTSPRSSYAEGGAYPAAPTASHVTLTKASPATPWTTYDVPHLASVNLRAFPGQDLSTGRWRLRVVVDGPGQETQPAVVVVVARRHHPATRVVVPLSRSGSGATSVPFGGVTRQVTVTLANASTRYDCHTGGGYACDGTSQDPRSRFAVRMIAVRR